MNEGLKAVRRLQGLDRVGVYDEIDADNDFQVATEHLEYLDIIVKKEVDFHLLKHTSTLQTYNDLIGSKERQLTEIEYSNLLELEVLL